jgi:hypothetical protein
MTIDEISDVVLTRLGGVPGAKTVAEWGPDIEALAATTAKLPALFVLYSGTRFRPRQSYDQGQAAHDDTWTVVAIDQNLRGNAEVASGCYRLIEAVRAELTGFDTGDGRLWPVVETLVFSGGTRLGYALEYTVLRGNN